MRITSGIYKSRQIAMPKGIRPTQDKVRKAVFDILGDIGGLSFLELYAGSGAVGLEAKSRGAGELVFVEDNRDCIPIIQKNIIALKVTGYNLITLSADKAIEILQKEAKSFDIIFLDPPYYRDMILRFRSAPKAELKDSLAKKTLQIISACDILAPNGLLVAQHYSKDDLPGCLGVLSLFKRSRYGDTILSFYRRT